MTTLASDSHIGTSTISNQDGDISTASFSVSTTASTVQFGSTNSTITTMRCIVYIFELPNLGVRANPFTSAIFTCRVTNAHNTFGNFAIDLYGLPSRASSTVLGTDYYTGSSDTTNATKLVDNFVNWPNSSSIPATGDKTTSVAALVTYLNAQYDNGNGIGKFVFLRLSADKIPPQFKAGTFAMSEDSSADPKIDFVVAP